MLDKYWSPGVSQNEKPCYQPVLECTYWTVLGYFNTRNMIKFTNKGISSEYFNKTHKIALDGISDNIHSLEQTVKYGTMNITDTKTIGYIM